MSCPARDEAKDSGFTKKKQAREGVVSPVSRANADDSTHHFGTAIRSCVIPRNSREEELERRDDTVADGGTAKPNDPDNRKAITSYRASGLALLARGTSARDEIALRTEVGDGVVATVPASFLLPTARHDAAASRHPAFLLAHRRASRAPGYRDALARTWRSLAVRVETSFSLQRRPRRVGRRCDCAPTGGRELRVC